MGAAGETVIGSAVIAGGLELTGSSEEAFAQRAGTWSEYVARRFRGNKADVALVRDPVETLTPLFVRDVNALALEHPVVLCFDTWEQTGASLGDWLRGLVREGLSANVWPVIAGRHPPTLDGMIASLEPIPSLEELLAPSWHDPSTPCRRTLTGSRKNHVDRLEKTIMGLGQHGDDIEAGALREEVLQAVTA